ncbi:histone-lysine N-methyltransferase SETMAR [Schistocerca nitens]|uniref:histone-lysine N-methyltransferase SETMAR n=1 Tax=Schistocerca nitens TaxID=7011 RepID=UPI0021189B94|nr:histone-lysine N-methyltransferase SETMAR [Schistocerca nitens]
MCDNVLSSSLDSEILTGDEENLADNYNHPIEGLIYTPCNIPGPGANIEDFETQYAVGCSCRNGICVSELDCVCIRSYNRSYDENGCLLPERIVGCIMECNSLCLCGHQSRCGNRICQLGPADGLEICMTGNGKGMGLRTTKKIAIGSFICEYAGEIIGIDEAKRRAQSQSDSDMNYIFVLNEHLANGNLLKTCVDPTVIGNIGRYINHSCQPNSVVIPVRTNTLIPKIGIFAADVIQPGEEITFDYGGNSSAECNVKSNKLCLCGSTNCKKYLPYDALLYLE